MLDYNQLDSTEAFHKFHHISLINKNHSFVLDCEWSKPKTKISKAKMAQNDKVRDLLRCFERCRRRNSNFHMFQLVKFDSFIRGYHVYQHIWTPVEGETYSCTCEPGNEPDCNAVAVMYEDRVVGHIPLAISKCISLFLTLLGSLLETKVTEKRINRGGGYGLEVPCKYRISGQEKAVWSCMLDKEKSDHISTRTLACCK